MPGKKKPSDKREKTSSKRPIEQYEHKSKTRANNPPVGLVTQQTDPPVTSRKTYAYDPHLDPQLVWAGKKEHTSFEVPTVSLHVHERIDPRTIIEAVRKRNGAPLEPAQGYLFETREENPPLREAVDFYRHPHGWTNRLIAGDSLLVMNSLLEKEGMAGQVQMVYIDPPYGIRYGSNFQPFVNRRDVKDGKDEDLTQEPEMVRAFRDTWELGIHSYLTYLRDRLFLARDLLHESGSVFVQISDENLHFLRTILDEVFGCQNFVATICYKKPGQRSSDTLPVLTDFVLWFARDKEQAKYRQLYVEKALAGDGGSHYNQVELPDGTVRTLTQEERADPTLLPKNARVFQTTSLTSAGAQSGDGAFTFEGKVYNPPAHKHWSCSTEGLKRVAQANRIVPTPTTLRYKRFFDDLPMMELDNRWNDVGLFGESIYVVQTSLLTIERCILMTTDPGDIVFDPTCGSGTTAFVAEQWGRRWITCDTSRVATTLAKQRLMSATFDYYRLAHPDEGVGSGFQYKKVPHVTLKSIANNEPPGEETLYDQPVTDNSRARVSGPFTVEAVPAPNVKSIEEIGLGGGGKKQIPHPARTAGIRDDNGGAGIRDDRVGGGAGIRDDGGGGPGIRDDGQLYVAEVRGFDYFNTRTGAIESGDTQKIAMWLLDTDYDGRSLYPRQVFFPMAADDEGWAKLARNLKAEIDPELIESYRGTVSLPFALGEHRRVAVKVIDDRGIESLKVVEVA